MTEIDALQSWLGGFLLNMEAPARRALAHTVAIEMRRRQSVRIAGQINPDGSNFEPRKPQIRKRPGRVKRAMFMRLRTARFLKAQASPEAAVVTFIGRTQRIAAVHQFGLRDRVNKAGLEITYPKRELLGFEDGDIDLVADLVLAHIAR